MKLTIRNIAACQNFNTTIDLDAITMANGFKQDKKKLFASIIWMDKPRASSLVFQKGRAVVVGATNESMSLLAGIRLLRLLKMQIPELKFQNFSITNILATGHFGAPVDLHRLAREHPFSTNFKPSLFPGLSFDVPHPSGRGRLTANVFLGGSVVLAGACSLTDMHSRLALLWTVIGKYTIRDPEKAAEFLKSAEARRESMLVKKIVKKQLEAEDEENNE